MVSVSSLFVIIHFNNRNVSLFLLLLSKRADVKVIDEVVDVRLAGQKLVFT